uniref:peroxidase n=1 Tax=Chenopodium quinoa TaxID=63459 RepID=A0A803NAT9_CHEQI
MEKYNQVKIFIVFVMVSIPFTLAKVRVGFYGTSCPQAESIVQQAVQHRFAVDQSVTAAPYFGCISMIVLLGYHNTSYSRCNSPIGGQQYNVPTGRRDGLVSSISEVDLPGPTSTIS